MQSVVRVSKSQLDYFRRLARDTKLEIQAYLVGKVVNPELTIIDRFEYTKNYYLQTVGDVQWFMADFEKVKANAEDEGLRIVGEIHSHPSWDAVMSPTDYKTHIEDGHRVSGLCSTDRRKTRVRFWIAESALSCKIEYK